MDRPVISPVGAVFILGLAIGCIAGAGMYVGRKSAFNSICHQLGGQVVSIDDKPQCMTKDFKVLFPKEVNQ